MTITEQIAAVEDQLRQAMEAADVDTLDGLLHADLQFTIPTGQTVTKAADLEAYRKRHIEVFQYQVDASHTTVIDDHTAVVTAEVTLGGLYLGMPMDGDYKYLRVWRLTNGQWQVIAGSSHQV